MAGSIMPAGLADELTRPELVDLVRFLSELGKVGPYSVGTRRVFRRWQVLEPTPDARDALARGGPEAVLRDDRKLAWRPAYTTVAGSLPPSEWATPAQAAIVATVALARTQIQVDDRRPGQAIARRDRRAILLSRRPPRRAGPGRTVRRARWSSIWRRACILSRWPSRAIVATGSVVSWRTSRARRPGAGRPGEMSREEPEHRDPEG